MKKSDSGLIVDKILRVVWRDIAECLFTDSGLAALFKCILEIKMFIVAVFYFLLNFQLSV